VIKVTFEGKDYYDVAVAMTEYLYSSRGLEKAEKPEKPAKPKPPWEKPAKPEKSTSPKPDAAERMAKARAAKAAKPKAKAPEPPPSDPRSSDEAAIEQANAKLDDMILEADLTDAPEPEALDPSKLAALRLKTTEDLQAAYSGGKHKAVLALLSKYGNGAKTFRELKLEDFVPIRKAIDEGALQ
jgi:hypothetical protein